jgi:glycosyltransferase involved in cell wall biosynthesis
VTGKRLRRRERATGAARVLFAHPSPDLYGSDRMLVESVRSLTAAGCVVTVALPSRGPLVPLLEETGATVSIVPTVVLRKAFMSPVGIVKLAVAAVRTLPGAMRAVRRADADVVYVNTVTIPLWVVAARLAGAPVVAHVHEAEDSFPKPILVALNLPLLLARRVLVNSLAAERGLHATLPSLARRIRLLYNGVAGPDQVTPPRKDRTKQLRLLLVGRLSPRKGTDVAIAALDRLARRGVDARLDLVGEVFPGYDWYERDLREQVHAAGLDGLVDFAGFHTDVWPWFADADIVLVPSRTEPFGNVAVEAALAGRPGVASAVQGLQEIVVPGETGTLVAADDPDALADAVYALAQDWPAALETAERARTDAELRFGTKRYGDDLMHLLLDAGVVPA